MYAPVFVEGGCPTGPDAESAPEISQAPPCAKLEEGFACWSTHHHWPRVQDELRCADDVAPLSPSDPEFPKLRRGGPAKLVPNARAPSSMLSSSEETLVAPKAPNVTATESFGPRTKIRSGEMPSNERRIKGVLGGSRRIPIGNVTSRQPSMVLRSAFPMSFGVDTYGAVPVAFAGSYGIGRMWSRYPAPSWSNSISN